MKMRSMSITTDEVVHTNVHFYCAKLARSMGHASNAYRNELEDMRLCVSSDINLNARDISGKESRGFLLKAIRVRKANTDNI